MSTLHRHISRGIKARDGSVVKLEAIRIGGRWATTRDAVLRFVEALTTRSIDTPPALPPRESHRRAVELLDRVGI